MTNNLSIEKFSVNGRSYSPSNKPIVVICIDGSADEYLDATADRGRLPNIQSMSSNGYRGMARGSLPSFTNVNNSSIMTGVPVSQHGICGNYFFDEINNEEVMMNSPKYLRADSILAAAADSGRKVAVVTAKDKLRTILSHNLNGIGISAEKANEAQLSINGIENVESIVGYPTPSIYSPDASLFALRAGTAFIKNNIADFLYLSLTDYMQHTYAPDEEESLAFYEEMDKEIGKMLDLGAIIGITADHGMNAKIKSDGTPNVLFLEDMLEAEFGEGFRVICPITDPYVKHHGALGSFVTVYIDDKSIIEDVKLWLSIQSGITEVHDKRTAARLLEQPVDRIGDLIVMSGRNVVLGRRPQFHDLSALDRTLRSHGGRYEEMVPFVISHPLNEKYRMKAMEDPRNFDVFDFTINGTHKLIKNEN